MALSRTRQAARRVKDKWKAKSWYRITAPASFNNKVLAESLADEADKLMGRTVEVTLHELTGDMKQMHVKLTFQVTNVTGLEAKTAFMGHNMTSDYVRRLTRRGHSKVAAVYDLQTKDGSRVRVKPFAITDRRAQTTQMQDIRRIMRTEFEKAAAEKTLSGFLSDFLVGDLTTRIYKECRKVHPLRRIEVAKSEIITAPTLEVDETPVLRTEPPAAPATAEGAAATTTPAGGEPTAEESLEVTSQPVEEEGVETPASR